MARLPITLKRSCRCHAICWGRVPRGATQRPSAAVQRLQDEAGFVEKDDGSSPAASPFLIRGQASRRQPSIAASSRSRTLRCGFWGGETQVAQNPADVVGMVRYLELTLHDLRHTSARPEVGFEAGRLRASDHHLPESIALHRSQSRRGAPRMFDNKGSFAPVLEGFLPAFYAREADTQHLGDFRKRHPNP